MSVIVTDKGQVTIPDHVLEFLGLGPGSSVDFRHNEKGEVVLVPVAEDKPISFAEFIGHAGPGMTTDEVMAMTRGKD